MIQYRTKVIWRLAPGRFLLLFFDTFTVNKNLIYEKTVKVMHDDK